MNFVVWHDGRWYDNEQPKLLGPLDHGMGMASVVFDGARGFDGLAPDLDQHCSRVIESAKKMLLMPSKTAGEIEALCREALDRLPKDAVTYIRPMFYAMDGFVLPVSEIDRLHARGLRACLARSERHALLLFQLSASSARHGADRRQGGLRLSEPAASAAGSA